MLDMYLATRDHLADFEDFFRPIVGKNTAVTTRSAGRRSIFDMFDSEFQPSEKLGKYSGQDYDILLAAASQMRAQMPPAIPAMTTM